MEFKMFDRHFLGDVTLAILLAIPTAVMAQPGSTANQPTAKAPTEQAAAADASAPASDRYSLLARS